MKLLFVASEIYPYVKTGGLGDVAGALPLALKKEGVDIRLLLPGYPEILKNLTGVKILRKLPKFFGRDDAKIITGKLSNGLTSYVLDCPGFYDRTGPYGDEKGKDWKDNHLRFAALGRTAADLHLYDENWQADIIHGHDWQCGMMPTFLSMRGKDRPLTVMTIHNIAYQGLFPGQIVDEINLPGCAYQTGGAEFYGKVGFLKAGIHYADVVTTVSPTYAVEIQGEEFGCGLQGLLRERSNDLTGIINGIDEDIWNPKTDKNFFFQYDSADLKSKTKNREALLQEFDLSVEKTMPVFGVVSRLVSQKGLDLLLAAMPEFIKMGAGFVILGSGDKVLEKEFQALATAWPAQVAVSTQYDEALAHRIIAGADAVIIPSRFEPCGLVQLYGLRYGTLPIVRKTGGLADTVIDNGSKSTGFVFDNISVDALSDAMARACSLFRSQSHWKKRQENAMAKDFGWKASALQYIALYEKLLKSGPKLR